MDSFFARNRLSAYLDGALSDAEAAELSDAIERDPKLRAEYVAMQRAIELLRREGPTQAPTGFHARVMEAVADEPGTGGVVVRVRRWWNRVPVEAVALAAAAAVVVLVIQGKPGSDALNAASEAVNPLSRSASRAPEGDAPPLVAANPSEREAEDGEAKDAAGAPADANLLDAGGQDAVADAQPASPNKKLKSRGADEPTEPYVAEWEQGSGEMATPMGYRLSVTSAEVLFNLSGIAQQANGSVRDSAGRKLQPRMLSDRDDYAQLMLVVPRDQTEAVRGHLQAMGGEAIPTPSATSLYPADRGVFVVEVRYRP